MKKIASEGPISNSQRIKAFSAAFPGDPIDESNLVTAVCEATGAEKFVVTPTWEDFWRDLPLLVRCQEEPFEASFVYSQWRVMKCARERGVRVVFEGHGGDELLCGYLGYYFYYFLTLVKHMKWRRLLTEALLSFDLTKDAGKTIIARASLHTILTHLGSVINGIFLRRAALLQQSSADERSWLSEKPTTDLAAKLENDVTALSLPPVLRSVDKNSMWHSIEVRLPFLHKAFFDYFAVVHD
jgi:asparagine synthase (glutamine-hydrolysing)